MKLRSTRAGIVLLGTLVGWFSGCRAGVGTIPTAVPPPAPAATTPAAVALEARVTRTGYTVQVGAFSVPDNARRLAQALNDMGLDAYFFRQRSGLFKVRFGDFPTRNAAVREAERVLGLDLVEDYFIVGPESHPFHGRSLSGTDLRVKLVATAESFVGVDYTWGGTSRRDGVDCSGLVRAVYQLNGLSLPRTMADQYRTGTLVSRDRLREGDLVFFSDSPGRTVSHVGIYVGEDVFIHAPGQGKKVRQESLDGHYFRERFSGARAYLD